MSDANPFFVTPDWLQQRLGQPGLKIVDGSWYLPAQKRDARAEYNSGHIPGAVFFDQDKVVDPNSSLPHTLPSPEFFARELDREFPAVRRVVDDLYAELAKKNADADAAFERDAVWPPGGFWERRETARALASLPYLDGADFLAELPREHLFRDVVTAPARFASDQIDTLPPFAVASFHGAWTRGVSRLADGEDELTEFLLERVRAHGGDTRMNDRARAIVHKGGKVRGRDVKHDKLTYVRARGLDGAKALAKEAADEAVGAAVVVGDRAGRDPALLVRLARFAVERNH